MSKELNAIHIYSKNILEEGNRDEMTDVIYDTLFQNTQYPQFDINKTTPLSDDAYEEHQSVDKKKGIIKFGYCGHEYKLTCELIK